MNKKRIYIIIPLLIVISFVFLYIFRDTSDNAFDYENVLGHSFIVSDDSYIIFNDDKTFYWYKDKDNLEDNYFYGTYTIYRGENAINYISSNLAVYSITNEDQLSMIERKNEENAMELYYNWNLVNEKQVVNGETTKINKSSHYYGFASVNYGNFDLIDMDSSNYGTFFLDK